MDGKGWVTPAIWELDPRETAWRRLPDLGTPRHGTERPMLDGRLFVFGGTPCPGYARLTTAESLSYSRR